MGGTISTELPNGGPPKRLSESPWTDEDEVIVEFFFQNEKSYAVNVAKNWKSYQSGMYACFMIPHTLPFAILSLPFWPHMLSANRKKIRFNEVETLWTRRLAITKNGIAYKTLPGKYWLNQFDANFKLCFLKQYTGSIGCKALTNSLTH